MCSLHASSFAWQTDAQTFALTTICKATFDLRPYECVLSTSQEPLQAAEDYFDKDPTRSVCVPNDVVPHKPRADILLTGHAYAPNRQPVRSVNVRMKVGDVDKAMEVWCDRGFRLHDQQLLEGPRFTQMPLRWERAAGGLETNNPVGIRFDGPPDRYGMIAIPNLQPMGIHVSQRAHTFAPIGFGPIGSRWPSRMQKLGRYAGRYVEHAWKDAPLANDFDYGYFNAAPLDQQVKEIRPDERIILENLHPEYARLVTNLPGLEPRAVAERATGEREEIRLVADTLWIDTERSRCTVVWRGTIGLRHAREPGRITVWLNEKPSNVPHISTSPAIRGDEAFDASVTMRISCERKEERPLPFVPGASALATRNDADSLHSAPRPGAFDPTGTMLVSFLPAPASVLPFESNNAQPVDDEDLAQTLPPMPLGVVESTPFPQASPVPADAYRVPFEVGALSGEPAPLVPLAIAQKSDEVEVGAKAANEVAPPPMIGPIAVPSPADLESELIHLPVKVEQPKTHAIPALEESAKRFDPAEVPLEKCAALTASIARTKPQRAKILEREELTDEQWVRAEKHWADAIKEETKRGKRELLDRFDAAYVAQLEKERGPITVDEYARICVANERGTMQEVLRGLELPKGAIIRIERVWLRKMMHEPLITANVDEAIGRVG